MEGARRRDPSRVARPGLQALNRGTLLTPFHDLELMSPATTEDDVDRHTEGFARLVA